MGNFLLYVIGMLALVFVKTLQFLSWIVLLILKNVNYFCKMELIIEVRFDEVDDSCPEGAPPGPVLVTSYIPVRHNSANKNKHCQHHGPPLYLQPQDGRCHCPVPVGKINIANDMSLHWTYDHKMDAVIVLCLVTENANVIILTKFVNFSSIKEGGM